MVCPNHDDTQICPDCAYSPHTGRNYFVQAAAAPVRRSLPPLEQHKADLEMIIAACVTGADKTGEDACTSIAKLANGMLVRISTEHATTRAHREETVFPSYAQCIYCEWRCRGGDAGDQAYDHTMTTGHPTGVERLERIEYRR